VCRKVAIDVVRRKNGDNIPSARHDLRI